MDMEGKFIYVFSEGDKDSLLCMGFSLLHCDVDRGIYVFLNRGRLDFCEAQVLNKVPYVVTDTLTFS